MFYRLTVRRKDFHFEEFFAAKRPPTQRQLIKYYSGPDRAFGDMADMIQIVKYILEDDRCNYPTLRKNVVSGEGFDSKGNKYTIIVQRIEFIPLGEKIDGSE